MKNAVIGIAGWKNAGKTTLVERLVGELVARGRRVATVKHAHHDAEIDVPGTDSYRHRAAGASEVALVTARRVAIVRELRGDPEPALDEVLARLAVCDVVIVEGYKRERHDKIELRRGADGDGPLAGTMPNVVAIAADHPVAGGGLPVFALDDVAAIADFVERHCGLDDGG